MKYQPGFRLHSHGTSPRAGAVRLACAGGLLSAVIASAGWAYQDAAPVGLTGILPDEEPAGLTADAPSNRSSSRAYTGSG